MNDAIFEICEEVQENNKMNTRVPTKQIKKENHPHCWDSLYNPSLAASPPPNKHHPKFDEKFKNCSTAFRNMKDARLPD